MLKSGLTKNLKSLNKAIAVAGHICLDIIPSFNGPETDFRKLFFPGNLINVGPAMMTTGGAVSNTGLALYRLGVPIILIGKIGSDPFGKIILDLLNTKNSALTRDIIITSSSHTSYTVVISPPGCDRMFLHSSGANDDFGAADIHDTGLGGVRLFHFGYPPLMRRMYQNDGQELEDLFRWVKKHDIITSLDLAKPDPQTEAGSVDWRVILERVLPFVDIFQPSVDEILYMLDRNIFHSLTEKHGQSGFIQFISTELLDRLANTLIKMGSNVVAIKLGDQGLYLRTGKNIQQLAGAADPGAGLARWADRHLLAPCFQANVVGTNGAGDCTIAGLITGVIAGVDPIDALKLAVGVGACSTEKLDATSGVPSWNIVDDRIRAGWKCREVQIEKPGWKWLQKHSIWQGPQDKK